MSPELDKVQRIALALEAAPLWEKAALASQLGRGLFDWAVTVELRINAIEGRLKDGNVSTEATGRLRAVP